ncbi:MAG TPA: hypothetical protein VG755_21420 [Nannocystaceae bacterium]|nr:hypothetical protein [Nannocystaceae bacterium]
MARSAATIASEKKPGISVRLSVDDLALLCDAIDSHIYHELSDDEHRRSGYVEPPGAFDAGAAESITEADGLLRRLDALLSAERARMARRDATK